MAMLPVNNVETRMKPILVKTDSAPAAVGPYSQAAIVGDLVFCSGAISLDRETGEMVGSTVAEQATQALTNLKAVLEGAGSGLDLVAKTTVFLVDMDTFGEMNQVYASFFGDHRPARSTIAVRSLPKGALVEVEAIAVRRG
jgi:2-iminobutanoate/2-iminopropanoate deaminase